jgi:hypothetical protein
MGLLQAYGRDAGSGYFDQEREPRPNPFQTLGKPHVLESGSRWLLGVAARTAPGPAPRAPVWGTRNISAHVLHNMTDLPDR